MADDDKPTTDDTPSFFGSKPAAKKGEPTQDAAPSFFAPKAARREAPRGELSGMVNEEGMPVEYAEPPSSVPQTLSNQPGDSDATGVTKNAATTGLRGASHWAGLGGDLYEQGRVLGAGALSLLPGGSYKQTLHQWDEDRAKNRAKEKEAILAKKPWYMNQLEWEELKRNPDDLMQGMPTGEDVFRKGIKPHTGEYEPTTELGKFGRAVGEAGVAGLVGGPTGAVAGGLGGAADYAAGQFTDNPYHRMAAAILAGGAPSAAKWGVGKYKGEQLTPAQERAKALATIDEMSRDPTAAWKALEDRKAAGLPDEPTAQASLDQGQALGQDTVTTTRHPAMMQALQAERLRQQKETQAALAAASPDGTKPTEVSANFLKHLEELQAEEGRLNGQLPKGLPGDQAGAALAETAQTAGKSFKGMLDKLKAAIDPEGILQSPAGGLRQHAHETLTDLKQRPFKEASDIATAKLEQAQKMPETVKFNDLVDFDQSLTTAMEKARLAGDGIGYSQIRELKGKVKDALRQTAENQAPGEAAAAAERLGVFNKGWGLYKDTYTKGEVGKALKPDGIGGQRGMTNADIATKAFASGAKGYENATMWLRAGGADGLARLKETALGRLQAEIKDGKVLDQAALDAYRSKYRDALRAIDEHEPGFSQQFDSPVTALENVRAFEKSEAGKFLGLESADTITAHVGTLLDAKNGAERISSLVKQASETANGDAIVSGLREAGRKWIEQKFQSAERLPGETGEPVPIFKGAQLRDFIGKNRDKLDSLFDPAAVEAMADVANKIDRSKMVQSLQNVQHNSATAGRLQGVEQQRRLLGQQIQASLMQDAQAGTASTFSAIAAFEFMRRLGEIATGTGSLSATVSAGSMMGLGKAWQVALARAGARRSAQQHRITDMVAQGFASRDFALALKEQAMTEHGMPNQRAFDTLARLVVGAEAAHQGQEGERARRASGGRVGELASHLVKAVEEARKMATTKTKPLLQQDDSMVANALAIAGKHI